MMLSMLIFSVCTAATIDANVATLIDDASLKNFTLFADGKAHYLATNVMTGGTDSLVLYGDGKTFFASKLVGYSSQGDGRYDLSVQDPRLHGGLYSLLVDAGQAKLQCDTRTATLKVVPPAEAQALFSQATVKRSPRDFGAYALSRDEEGNYYLVLRGRFAEIESKFRVYAGPKGNMKELKLTNVVSDSEGDIFASTKGELRLVLNRGQSFWIANKARKPLTLVPVDDNQRLIHNDLGVFVGQRYGTPCDDF